MNTKTIRKLPLLAGLFAVSGMASADINNGPDPYAPGYGFDTPTEAGWGGWNRGDAGTVYAEFDVFADNSYGTASDRTSKADIGSYGTTDAHIGWNNGTFTTGSKNLYSFSVVSDFNIDLTASSSLSGPLRVVFQTEEWGMPLDTGSVLLNGLAPTLSSVSYTDPAYPSSFGEVTLTQRLFYWDLASATDVFHFDFTGSDHSMSFTQAAIDIGPAPVPLPAAVWMFGAGLMSLLGVTRRKASAESMAA